MCHILTYHTKYRGNYTNQWGHLVDYVHTSFGSKVQKYYSFQTDETTNAVTMIILIKHLMESDSFLCQDTNTGCDVVKLR